MQVPSIFAHSLPDAGFRSSPTPDVASVVVTSPSSPTSAFVMISPLFLAPTLLNLQPLPSFVSHPVSVNTSEPTVLAPVISPVLAPFEQVTGENERSFEGDGASATGERLFGARFEFRRRC